MQSWEPCGKDHSLWHRTAMQPKAPQGGCLVEEQPQAGLQWICWGSTWTNPKELLLWGIFRWEEGAATGCSWCCGCAGLHLQNSHNELLPASCPSRSSSTPSPAQPSQSSPKPQINSGSSLQPSPPGMVSRWVQDFSGAPAEKPEGKLRITLSP